MKNSGIGYTYIAFIMGGVAEPFGGRFWGCFFDLLALGFAPESVTC